MEKSVKNLIQYLSEQERKGYKESGSGFINLEDGEYNGKLTSPLKISSWENEEKKRFSLSVSAIVEGREINIRTTTNQVKSLKGGESINLKVETLTSQNTSNEYKAASLLVISNEASKVTPKRAIKFAD